MSEEQPAQPEQPLYSYGLNTFNLGLDDGWGRRRGPNVPKRIRQRELGR